MTHTIIYLLHLDQPIGNARHYLGRSTVERLRRRLTEHAKGRGSSLTKAAVERGIGFTVAQLWLDDTPGAEQKLKALGRYRRHCTRCSPHVTFTAEHPIVRQWAPRPLESRSCDYGWNWLP